MNRMRTHSSRRRGLSLLEVLISAFVMSVGILSLLALIPVGGHQIAEANKLDRASTLGRAAFREIQVQGLLEPNRWMWANASDPGGDWLWDGGPFPPWAIPNDPSSPDPRPFPALTSNLGFQNVDDWGFPVCIDPLLISSGQQTAASDWPAQAFPYYPQPWSGAPFIPRVTITTPGNFSLSNPTPINFGTAERIFTSQDDPTFSVSETDPTERPKRLYTEDSSYRRLRGQWDGEFSWMMIASRPMSDISLSPTPAVPIPGFRYDIAPERRNTYDVSVLVFHRRNLDATITSSQMGLSGAVPSERVCRMNFGGPNAAAVGFSPGGGSAVLSMQDYGGTSTAAQIKDWLTVKPDQWIGVMFMTPIPSALQTAAAGSTGAPAERPVIRWYKVLSVGDIQVATTTPQFPYRPVTLVGPDWNSNEVALGTVPYAIILDNLVGVYQKTMTRQ